MDILSYLSELIKTHKEVGIPGLGTFYKKKHPGRYDKETHSFLPPVNVLEFNSEADEVDEQILLADFIREKENIDLESANYKIDQFADEIKQQLADHKHADLEPIGRLSLIDNDLVFVADRNFEAGNEFYGLPTLKDDLPTAEEPQDIPPMNQPIVTENNVGSENNNEIEEIPAPVEEKEIEIAAVEEADTAQEVEEIERSKTPLYVKFLLGILIILIALLLTYFVKPNLFDNVIKNSNAFFQNTLNRTESKKAPDEPENNIAPIIRSDSIKKDSLKVDVPSDSMAKDSSAYEVIGASVHSQKEAEDFIDFAKKKWGVDAKIVSKKKGKKIKISIASFNNIDTAKAERNRLAKKLRVPGLYIYTNNQK